MPYWPKWCYAPLSVALGTVAINEYDATKDMPKAMVIAALAPWRRSKEVYVMDADMQELLFEQADDLKLQPEILKHLPYPCFYVQFAQETTPYHGFFICGAGTGITSGTAPNPCWKNESCCCNGSLPRLSPPIRRTRPSHCIPSASLRTKQNEEPTRTIYRERGNKEMLTEAQKRANAQYEARAITQVKLKLNKRIDADILEALERSGNKQGYIKTLIRADIAAKSGV